MHLLTLDPSSQVERIFICLHPRDHDVGASDESRNATVTAVSVPTLAETTGRDV
jgi:hypothetical protein